MVKRPTTAVTNNTIIKHSNIIVKYMMHCETIELSVMVFIIV